MVDLINPLERDLDRDCQTLSRHVLEQLGSYGPEAQDLSALLGRIGLAAKLIARHLSRAGLLDDALGLTGEVNVQGESVHRLDDYANHVFISVFRHSGLVCRLASEEMEHPYYIPENCPLGRYTLLYDPIDGSGNVDVGLDVGSIFAIRTQTGVDADGEARDLLGDGHSQIAAGYVLYGPATVLVYSIGRGVHSFVLDPSLGEFVLTQANLRMPEDGRIFSANTGNLGRWPEPLRQAMVTLQTDGDWSARYSGALVADFHRILQEGGVFLYPGTTDRPNGKLRLLYEAAPLAFLAEQAGGAASDGDRSILDRQADRLHARTPLILGSRAAVARFTVPAPASPSRS